MKRPAPMRPSLRRRLLVFLLIPMATLLLLDALLSYGVALAYANRVHDRDLADDARTLAKLLQNNPLGGRLSRQARFLLEYDPDGRSYFSVRSSSQGLLAGDDRLAASPTPTAAGLPALYDTRLDGHALRAATVREDMPGDAAGQLTVTVAETLHDRREQAREILLLAVVMQTLLIVCVLSLVWFGVRRGLRVLDPLTARLAARSNELTPIDGPDVPQEIQPLTRTIDALFGRLRDMLALHDRFIADAAHQLRTPLAGLKTQLELALDQPMPPAAAGMVRQAREATDRIARMANQLLALARAEPGAMAGAMESMDLAEVIGELVDASVHAALDRDVDLGFELAAARVEGDATLLRELATNLIDNAVRYCGRGGHVTVRSYVESGHAVLEVEDDGPGIPPEERERVLERFYRLDDAPGPGSGLGLAIVKEIAAMHRAELRLGSGSGGRGLRATVRFA